MPSPGRYPSQPQRVQSGECGNDPRAVDAPPLSKARCGGSFGQLVWLRSDDRARSRSPPIRRISRALQRGPDQPEQHEHPSRKTSADQDRYLSLCQRCSDDGGCRCRRVRCARQQHRAKREATGDGTSPERVARQPDHDTDDGRDHLTSDHMAGLRQRQRRRTGDQGHARRHGWNEQ